MHAWINITHPGFSGRQDMPDDGDQWVSWEQMVAMLRAKGNADGRAAQLAREVVELRGEVAKLKPLEMILAKGGDPVQHLSEAVLDLSAKLRSAEDATRIMDREYFGLNNKLREARAEIDLLKETAQAPAVVVPELPTWEDGENKLRRGEKLTALEKFVMDHDWHKTDTTFRDGLEAAFAELRAIPADRELGEGMVGVRREDAELAIQWYHAVQDLNAPYLGQADREAYERLRALRANQGGAAT